MTQVVLFILRREGVGESRTHPHVTGDVFRATWDGRSGGFADGSAGRSSRSGFVFSLAEVWALDGFTQSGSLR